MQFKLGIQYWARLDYQKAFNWIKAAADRGHPDAIYQLGMAYLFGRGMTQKNTRSSALSRQPGATITRPSICLASCTAMGWACR